MTKTIDPAKLKAAAEHLERVLERYPDSTEVRGLLRASSLAAEVLPKACTPSMEAPALTTPTTRLQPNYGEGAARRKNN